MTTFGADDAIEAGGNRLMEKVERSNGKAAWMVPEWFIHALLWVAATWIMAISATCIYCYSRLSAGNLYPEAAGIALEKRVDQVEDDLKDTLAEVKEAVKANNTEIRKLYDLLVSQRKESQ